MTAWMQYDPTNQHRHKYAHLQPIVLAWLYSHEVFWRRRSLPQIQKRRLRQILSRILALNWWQEVTWAKTGKVHRKYVLLCASAPTCMCKSWNPMYQARLRIDLKHHTEQWCPGARALKKTTQWWYVIPCHSISFHSIKRHCNDTMISESASVHSIFVSLHFTSFHIICCHSSR